MLRTLALSAALFVSAPALACPMADAAAFAKAAEQVQAADGTKVSLAVTGMGGNGCSSKVVAALTSLEGVNAVAVDHQSGAAEIAYDAGKVDVAALVSAIETTGFKAEPKQDV